MKKVIALALILIAINVFSIGYAEEAPQEVKDLAQNLAVYGKDPEILQAVKAENSKNKSLDQIKQLDEKWKSTPGIADYMNSLMTSKCGQRLRDIQNSKAFFSEIFVTDNQGANVAMTDKTSDYWQGDEAKFQKCFNNGQGKIFIDKVEFDESTQTYLVQVSVPVMDNDKTIGIITFGINVDAL